MTPDAVRAAAEQLVDVHERFAPLFGKEQAQDHAYDYVKGLMVCPDRKSVEPIALLVGHGDVSGLQKFINSAPWQYDDVQAELQAVFDDELVPSAAGSPVGVVGVIDESAFAKQGVHSAGVARQHNGRLGKEDNCQVGVFLVGVTPAGAALLDHRLYLPEPWADDADRRTKAKVPEAIPFQTKPQIALDLLDRAKQWGVRWACVTADADYGDNPNFLAGLEERRQRYVVAVRADFAVTLARRGGEARRADALVAAQATRSWRSVTWREGSQGWMRGRFVAVRCWRVTSSGRRRAGWLIGEDASDGKRRYYWSNFGAEALLERMVEYAHRRHWVEQYHEEAKGLLGWDQYQGRQWGGFHRHAACVMLAYSFLVWREWQQRQERTRPGRPRRAFSPSAGSTEGVATGGASADQRLAPARSGQGVVVA